MIRSVTTPSPLLASLAQTMPIFPSDCRITWSARQAGHETVNTIAITVMGGDLLANGNRPENAECDILSLAKELAIIGTVVLRMRN